MTVATLPVRSEAAPVASARGGALSLGQMTPHEAWLFASSLADTPLLPDAYRRQPASVLWAMEYGRALGLDVVTTITTIHVIKGKPTQSADLMLSRARAAGHRVRIRSTETACSVSIWRSDDPEFENVITWTLADAVQAGLCELRNDRPWSRSAKGEPQSWEKYPRAMLRARAIAECVRVSCPEVLHGAIYTPEELGAVVDQEGNAVHVERVDAVPVDIVPTAAPAPERPDFLALAQDCADAAAVRSVWEQAKAAGAPQHYLDQLAAIGRDKPGARVAEQPVEPVVEAAVVEEHQDQDDEHAAALAAMYDAGSDVGMSRDETSEAFTARYPGQTPEQAPLDAVRAMRDDLLDVANGGAE